MKNINSYLLEVVSSILFVIGTLFLLFSNTLILGAAILIFGLILAIVTLNNESRFLFNHTFLSISAILSLIIIAYLFFINYSRNIVIISTSFFALNFLIQINKSHSKKVKVVKPIKQKESIKQAINELKEEIIQQKEENKDIFFYTHEGKSFHVAGCISLSRTPREKIKTNYSRQDLIGQGFKTCKICNS